MRTGACPSAGYSPSPSSSRTRGCTSPALQKTVFRLAAQKGIGVLSSASYAVEVLKEKVQIYRDALKDCEPVGEFIIEFWGNNVHGFCDDDDDYAKETGRRVDEDLLRPGQALHRRAYRRLRRASRSLGWACRIT